MTSLNAPSSSDELYHSRADEVTPARPLLTGDVIADLELPGIAELSSIGMVVSHPCSMRGSQGLAEYVVVAAVQERDDAISNASWNGHYRIIPLPGLVPSEGDKPFRYANFNLLCSIQSKSINYLNRTACLSEYGIQLLQQRYIFSSTRLHVDLPTIQLELAPVFIEAELGEEWADAAIAKERPEHHDAVRVARRAETEMQAFLGRGDSERRANLKDVTKRSLTVSEVRREIRKRYPI